MWPIMQSDRFTALMYAYVQGPGRDKARQREGSWVKLILLDC